ncbi:MAG: zinc-binding dehydrogenase [Candidatus Dormibacteraeota bacterium]|nr:zinc-binding dehydrogenase [Candidatus Dormibacteraeota bacterium]
MRAAVLEAPNADLRIEEIPIPEPRAGEVLVKVAGCGVCHTDLHVIKEEVAFPTPCVLGHEISGTVAALGPGVDGPSPGTSVVSSFIMPCGSCRHCNRGRDDLCERFFAMNRLRGTLYDGETRLRRKDGTPLWMYSMAGLAEYAVVPATDVFELPAGLPLVESAIVGCAMFTAYGAVRHGADLHIGDRVAVVAVGGVGSNLIQVCRAFGASRIIAVDVRPDKLEAATQLGATDVIDASSADAVQRLRDLTGGEGVDVAFEALGRPQTFTQAFEMVKDGGQMVAVGIAPGTTTANVEITRLVRREISLSGSYGARTRADMPAILQLAAQGFFRPERVVTGTVPLEEADAVYKRLNRGEVVGRVVVSMNQTSGAA